MWSGRPALKARRIRWPSSVRIGMFIRFGFDDESRPVAVLAWPKDVCTRPLMGSTSWGNAST